GSLAAPSQLSIGVSAFLREAETIGGDLRSDPVYQTGQEQSLMKRTSDRPSLASSTKSVRAKLLRTQDAHFLKEIEELHRKCAARSMQSSSAAN
ncbi:MAG: hypothetical protein ACSLE2_13080, partial [Lysobacterales bacterium]